MFVIDFDDTLFNTHHFKKARMETLQKIGVSEKDYQETYREALKKNDVFSYSNHRHSELLALRGYSVEKVMEALEKTTGDRLQKFLFPDTVAFMQKLTKTGESVVLLSLGEPSFQELKVKGSGIASYFDRIFMVENSKEYVIHEIIDTGKKEEDIWFINDKVGETVLVKNKFPRLRIVLRKSDSINEEEYIQSKLPYYQTLSEIYEYIREQ